MSDAWVGRYRLEAPMAAGGMGVCWKARDFEANVDVAIKVMRHDLAQHPVLALRFEREAEAMRRIDHPNVVRVLDQGRTDDNLPYLVMELLKGRTLKQILEIGTLTRKQMTRIVRDVARGLSAAHACGFVHRDVSPGNIMMLHDGSTKLLDFGLVTMQTSNDDTAPTKLTDIGVVMGKPQYVAPEVCCGDPATPRSDLYSLGVVLYQMLTGAPPFEGGVRAVFTAHMLKTVPPLAGEGRLEALAMSLLEKMPGDRPSSAQEVVDALG